MQTISPDIKDLEENIIKLINTSHNIALFGHEYIDGDAIGSILGLGDILESLGKNVSYYTPIQASQQFSFLAGYKKVQTTFDYCNYDCLIFLDFTPYKRIDGFTRGYESYFDKQKIINIDHHVADPEPNYTYILRDTSAIATCLILREFIYKYYPNQISTTTAEYLYLGLMTDSGNFLYPGDYARIFHATQQMMTYGVDKDKLTNAMFRTRSFASIKFTEKIITRLQKLENKCIWSWIHMDEYIEAGIERDEAKYGLTMMQNIGDTNLVLLVEINDLWVKISARSNGLVNCQKLMTSLGGGGHVSASGGKLDFGIAYLVGGQEIVLEKNNIDVFIGSVAQSIQNFIIDTTKK